MAKLSSLGVDGVPDFNVLHSRKHDDEVQLYAFDILTLDGEGEPPCSILPKYVLEAQKLKRFWPLSVLAPPAHEDDKGRKRQPTGTRKWFRFSDSECRRSVPPRLGRSVVDLIETHGHAA